MTQDSNNETVVGLPGKWKSKITPEDMTNGMENPEFVTDEVKTIEEKDLEKSKLLKTCLAIYIQNYSSVGYTDSRQTTEVEHKLILF